MEPSFTLPFSALAGVSESTRQEILRLLGVTGVEFAPRPAAAVLNVEGPAELTRAMVRRLTDGLGEKTTAALRAIAHSQTPEFRMSDVLSALEVDDYMRARAVWSALTRRTRKILDDPGAELVWWNGEGVYDDNNIYVDHVGAVAPLTHQSLRAHFGVCDGRH